jgi:hypothetical protein
MRKYTKKQIMDTFMDADTNFIDERAGIKIRKMISVDTLLVFIRIAK